MPQHDSGDPAERPLEVRLAIRVQTYDIDFAGHVNNAVYIRWLEDLRMELLRRHCPLETLLEQKLVPVIHSTHIRYERPLHLFHEPEGRMWCTSLGRATFNLAAEFHANGAVHCTATQRGILFDTVNNRPARWPEAFRANGAS